MSFLEMKQRMEELSYEERDELLGILLSLNDIESPQWQKAMADKIDDKDPSHWVSFDDYLKLSGEEGE